MVEEMEIIQILYVYRSASVIYRVYIAVRILSLYCTLSHFSKMSGV
jgi:hypothetical protein